MLVIDTDSHVTEPRDLWTSRMSARWGDLIPHVNRLSPEEEAWFIGDRRVSRQVAHSQFVIGSDGRPARVDGANEKVPQDLDKIHPSSYDAKERLKVMDSAGVKISCLYPNLLFFGYEGFGRQISESEFQLECVRSWNNFILEDWVSVAPDRFIPLAFIPFWDVDASVVEIQRCAGLGFKGLITTGAPHKHGQPYMADHHWDPIWAAAQDAQLPISFHSGGGEQRDSNDRADHLNPERLALEGAAASRARQTTCVFLDNAVHTTDLLMSGVLPRFPELKFISVESGLGWIPFVLETVDYHFIKNQVKADRPEFLEVPSAYFHRQVFINYWYEHLEDFHLDKIGIDHVLFETDYPHPTCLLADEVNEAVEVGLAGLSEADREKILWRNAAKLYNLDLAEPVS